MRQRRPLFFSTTALATITVLVIGISSKGRTSVKKPALPPVRYQVDTIAYPTNAQPGGELYDVNNRGDAVGNFPTVDRVDGQDCSVRHAFVYSSDLIVGTENDITQWNSATSHFLVDLTDRWVWNSDPAVASYPGLAGWSRDFFFLLKPVRP